MTETDRTTQKGIGPLGVAAGVIIAAVVLLVAAVMIYNVATVNDDLDCATRNAERATDGKPLLDC